MVYLDTNIVIYLLEANPVFCASVTKEIQWFIDQKQHIATSVLTLTEVLAYRDGVSQQTFESMGNLHLLPTDSLVAAKTAEIMRRHGLRLADAIHLATAINAGCETFFTNDAKLAATAQEYCEVLRPTKQ